MKLTVGLFRKVFLSSDTHFNHERKFVYEPRGFSTVEEMNEEIIRRWNEKDGKSDIVFLLGDVMLGDNAKGIECLKRLNGHISIIIGNHDTDTRIALYKKCPNVDEVVMAKRFTYKKLNFYLSHYPTLTGNLEANFWETVLNLYGHLHVKEKFYQDIPYMYNVSCDAQDCYPVELDQVIKEMKEKIKECKEFL